MGHERQIRSDNNRHPHFDYHRITEDKNRFQILLGKLTPRWVEKITHFFSNRLPSTKVDSSSDTASIKSNESNISQRSFDELDSLETQIEQADVFKLGELKALIEDLRKDLTMLKLAQRQLGHQGRFKKTYESKLSLLEGMVEKKISELTEEKKTYLSLTKAILKYCKTCDRTLEDLLIRNLNNPNLEAINIELLQNMVEAQLHGNQTALSRLDYIFNTSVDALNEKNNFLRKFTNEPSKIIILDFVRYCYGSEVDENSLVKKLHQLKDEHPQLYEKITRRIVDKFTYGESSYIDRSRFFAITSKVK